MAYMINEPCIGTKDNGDPNALGLPRGPRVAIRRAGGGLREAANHLGFLSGEP
jgi:hypothetical protein